MKSKALLNIAIVITSAAILVVLLGLLSPLLFKTQFNSPIYYGVVIAMAFASVVLGVIQIWPGLLAHQSRSKGHIPSLATDTESIMDALVRDDLNQQLKIRLWQSLSSKELDPIKNLETESEQNLPIKVTVEVSGTPVIIESADVRNIEKLVEQLTLLSQKYRNEVAREPAKADNYESGKSRVSANPVVGQIQPGIIRESKETYQADDPAEQP